MAPRSHREPRGRFTLTLSFLPPVIIRRGAGADMVDAPFLLLSGFVFLVVFFQLLELHLRFDYAGISLDTAQER